MANVLSQEKQRLCLKMLLEGASIRSVERTVSVHRDTIMRLMLKFGEGCQNLLDARIRGVNASHLEVDEQWTWVGKKNANCTPDERESGVLGDQYLFLGLDQATKLIVCHQIGKRTEETTRKFLGKLAARIVLPQSVLEPINEKPLISTDGFNAYPGAIQDTFGDFVQHGQIIKNYVNPESGRYAAPDLANCDRRCVKFVENLWIICTSHIERFNCTTRQFVKRFCRLTLAFSKKLANLEAAVSMHIANYNFCWQRAHLDHNGKATGKRLPPAAMQAGFTDHLWTFSDLYETVFCEFSN